jgi:hypothetical protein
MATGGDYSRIAFTINLAATSVSVCMDCVHEDTVTQILFKIG